jgi:death on curing protein
VGVSRTLTVYPSRDAVLRLHEAIVRQSGGEQGFVSLSNLAYVLETVKDIGEGMPDDKALVRKAGYLLFNLINLHPFLDGNKRTAYEITKGFLEQNGWHLEPAEQGAYATLVSISGGKLDAESTESWVATNLSKGGGKR